MTIRPAVLDDVSAILAIERASETAPHWAESQYREIMLGKSPVPRCLLVADGGFAVGKAVGSTGELESVVVAAASQKQGIGRALCLAVIAWCREQGAVEVELEVRAASVGPQRLYGSLGFFACGRRPRYYDDPVDDAILMRLALDPQ